MLIRRTVSIYARLSIYPAIFSLFNFNYVLKMKFKTLLIILCFVVVGESVIINEDVERILNLSSQLVKENIKISAKDSNNQPFTKYNIIVWEHDRKQLAYISVQDSNKNVINVNEKLIDGHSWFTVTFPSASVVHVMNIDLVFVNSIIPYPEEIKQNEKQLVKYVGQLYFISPYSTIIQKTTIKLSGNAVSFTQFKPFSEMSNKIKYGPYEQIKGFANQTFYVHFENNNPFITATNLERTLEISHWGNIAVRENIHLSHTGARLKGPFSRYEFQKDGRSGLSAVKSYKTILPASATEVYYRDTNGNISTSNMKILRDSVELELRPRFPLFGGWKSYYMLGYNVPSYEYILNKDETYVIQMRLIDHIFDDMLIDEAVVKIILPEGSSNIELTTPYPVIRHANELHFTYLDIVGRPVVVFSKKRLVENHILNFQLKYTFSKSFLMHEPLLAISFILAIFLISIIFLRLDCNINPHIHKE